MNLVYKVYTIENIAKFGTAKQQIYTLVFNFWLLDYEIRIGTDAQYSNNHFYNSLIIPKK